MKAMKAPLRFISVLLVMAITVTIGGCASKKPAKRSSTSLSTNSVALRASSAAATPDFLSEQGSSLPESEWTVYTNSKYKFSVSYPKSWGIEVEPETVTGDDPEGAVDFYPISGDRNNRVFVCRSGGWQYNIDLGEAQVFKTYDGISGDASYHLNGSHIEIHVLLEPHDMHAGVMMDKTVFSAQGRDYRHSEKHTAAVRGCRKGSSLTPCNIFTPTLYTI